MGGVREIQERRRMGDGLGLCWLLVVLFLFLFVFLRCYKSTIAGRVACT